MNSSQPQIVILTGSGISAESGIKTFRALNGLWEKYRIEDVATPEAFITNPKFVHEFYNERRKQLRNPNIKPNPAHTAIAKLEQTLGNHFLLITQNVDNLHERAGSEKIIHMHGELFKVRCTITGKIYHHKTDVNEETICECCSLPNTLRPHIVWFGEVPIKLDYIYDRLSKTDIFISIGTSGFVYPAANFRTYAKEHGSYTVELNLEETTSTASFDEAHHGLASDIVPNFLRRYMDSNKLA